ncbi:MAG: leucyl/phenylalanyl-tRNA--protein transferase, partial [Gammaproteobacteria bacterium]
MTRSTRFAPALLTTTTPYHQFPDPETALIEPDGLLAIGGDLHPERLLHAYRQGIFPWYSEGQPILWWSPDPRCVLFPEQLRISRSLQKSIRNRGYRVTFNQAFPAVIHACAHRNTGPRKRQEQGTWLTEAMIRAYTLLHEMGHAHSVECWLGEQLVGGLYGIRMG